MVVAYYTSTNFLDVVLETIQSFKTEVELHVFIEITNASKNTTIIDVESLEPFHEIEKPEILLGERKWAELKPYFESVKSVQFLVHKESRSLSYKSLNKAYRFGKYLKPLNVDVFHFDTISPRAIGLYFYLRSKKVFITLHDPVPHSGENNWREHVPNTVFYGMASGYFFYSNFARDQFKTHYPKIKAAFYNLQLQPYSFISQFTEPVAAEPDAILFFGRLSYYKGIDLLLKAVPDILKKYPNQKFIIAGKPNYDYCIEGEVVDKYRSNFEILLRHISIPELVNFLRRAKFVVCPYRDATQSGVLMTCMAAGKTVVATRVGSFPEYINHNVNGLLAEPNAADIAEKMMEALDKDRYKTLEKNVQRNYSNEKGMQNADVILSAYGS